jgi:hypothetical protein
MNKRDLILGVAGILFILVMLTGTTQAAISPYVGVSIGDEVEYEVTIFHIRQELNNIVYINKNPFDMEGNIVKIKINDITEEETGDFFGLLWVNKTKFITTESFGGKSFESYSYLDDWFETFSFLTFYYEMMLMGFNPDTFEFDEPESFNDSAENYDGLPVFASTNESFYQELENEIIGPSIITNKEAEDENPPFQFEQEFREVAYWEDRNEFFLNVSLYTSTSGSTSTGKAWDLNLGVDIVTHIDTANGFVKDLDYAMHQYVAIDTNSSLMKARQAFKKTGGGRPTITLDYNFIAPSLTILGVVATIIIRKKLLIKN